MRNQVAKTYNQNDDDFSGFTSAIEGQEQQRRIFSGTMIKFNNAARWETKTGDLLSPDLELVVAGVARVVTKWLPPDGKPDREATRILQPGEPFPNINAMNEQAPKSEWRETRYGPRPPWQGQHVVCLFDEQTTDEYWWPSPITTIGSCIAVEDVVKLVKKKRWLEGDNTIYVVVTLADVFFPTSYGGRQRPHLAFRRIVRFGTDCTQVETEAAPTQIEAKETSNTPLGKLKPKVEGGRDLNDDIPW
jgi:hypothetical protein